MRLRGFPFDMQWAGNVDVILRTREQQVIERERQVEQRYQLLLQREQNLQWRIAEIEVERQNNIRTGFRAFNIFM